MDWIVGEKMGFDFCQNQIGGENDCNEIRLTEEEGEDDGLALGVALGAAEGDADGLALGEEEGLALGAAMTSTTRGQLAVLPASSVAVQVTSVVPMGKNAVTIVFARKGPPPA